MTQFNGVNGCDKCLNPGFRVRKGRGTVHVYDSNSYPVRKHQTLLENATLAIEIGSPVFGIKGPSILNLIPCWDSVTEMVPDYMHCVLLGVVKQFLKMWSSDVSSDYYIQNLDAHLDALLLSVCLPDEILRVYRSMVKCFTDWKASELRNFLLFYSPIALSHPLPKKYFKHWMLLVKSFWLLLQKNISNENIGEAEQLLLQFVHDARLLYGVKKNVI